MLLIGLGAAAGCDFPFLLPEGPARWVEDHRPHLEPAPLTVGPIEQHLSDDKTQVFVGGTIRNGGRRWARWATVKVTAHDAQDRVVAQQEDIPTPADVPPGTDARYVVQLPNDPTITGFRVEATGR